MSATLTRAQTRMPFSWFELPPPDEEAISVLHADRQGAYRALGLIDTIQHAKPVRRTESQLPGRAEVCGSCDPLPVACFNIRFVLKLLFNGAMDERVVLTLD